jgi:DnaJ-class molecular chaperone
VCVYDVQAYRKLAMIHHPDKAKGGEAERLQAEAKFKDLTESYEVLSDPEKKRRYDSGADLQEMGGMGGGVDPSDFFNMFMGGGGGGGGHRHGHGGGGGGFNFHFG